MFLIKNLYVSIAEKEILHGVNFSIKPGEVHVVMGPNGSGKTTLAMSLMGHPGSNIQSGHKGFTFQIDGKDCAGLPPEERAKNGLFVSFQSPVEIAGVSFLAFLRTAAKSLRPEEKIPLSAFKKEVSDALRMVSLNDTFMHRAMNEGFSGGERKRAEIVQLMILKPKYAILDEIDSGLDIDSLQVVAKAIVEVVKNNKTGILLITHYQRILHYVKPDRVHVLVDGTIRYSGGMELVQKIEKEGYAAV